MTLDEEEKISLFFKIVNDKKLASISYDNRVNVGMFAVFVS